MSETETTTKPPSSRYSLISLLRSLHKASGKDVQVSDSNECLNKNSNAIEGQCSEPINEGKCCCGTEDKEKNSNRTSEEGDRNNPENVAESPIREVDSSSLLGLEPIWGKYAIEEYIEKDGKYYRTWSQEDAIQSSADPVNMTPLEMSRLKPENLKNQSISEESENLSDSPQDIEKWYKRERLSHQKLLHEMGIPNITDDMEVLSISTADHDYQEDDGIIDTAKSVPKEQPFNYDISVDIALTVICGVDIMVIGKEASQRICLQFNSSSLRI
ncbi:Meiosis-specific nuclear structural protein 1 [Frankliniella fusca]|uniref:Meiosis-specific nuclear structural protein 1 n=1 Tax=Frankliniella fusca TaxID=407009 RepID=A0AAE1HPD4_9NEOP|nr:Meiosis-specific nuclear structural protein 1 [Frankliniella fusca]